MFDRVITFVYVRMKGKGPYLHPLKGNYLHQLKGGRLFISKNGEDYSYPKEEDYLHHLFLKREGVICNEKNRGGRRLMK